MTSEKFATIKNIIRQCHPITVNCNEVKQRNGQAYYERYWRVAILLRPRDECGNVWVVGIKINNVVEYKAGTSIAVLGFVREAVQKMNLDSPNNGLLIFEPLGIRCHIIKPMTLYPLIVSDSPTLTTDPNQQVINFDAPIP